MNIDTEKTLEFIIIRIDLANWHIDISLKIARQMDSLLGIMTKKKIEIGLDTIAKSRNYAYACNINHEKYLPK